MAAGHVGKPRSLSLRRTETVMKPVFGDTSYFVAFLGDTDEHHEMAVELTENLLGTTVVTEYVLAELGNALSALPDRPRLVYIANRILTESAFQFVPASKTLLHHGLELF